jgi:hypothetical protein
MRHVTRPATVEEIDVTAAEPDGFNPIDVERLQAPRPVITMQGHEVCSHVHSALELAQSLLNSRDERVADLPATDSNEALLRELRAHGIGEAAPYFVGMVALVDAAVDRLSVTGAVDRDDAWQQIRKDVLNSHCQSPDSL